MAVSVRSRAHRVLVGTPGFTKAGEINQLPQLKGTPLPLRHDEELIGVWETASGELEGVVLVTTDGLYDWDGHNWRKHCYRDISNSEWPPEGKNNPQALPLRMKDGTQRKLFVKESGVFTFTRFVDRVVEDLKVAATGGKYTGHIDYASLECGGSQSA